MPITKNDETTLRVTDAQRAAVLLTLGCKLIDCPTNETGTRLTFLFDDTNSKAREAGAAIAQNLSLPITDYLDNLRRCNELIHQFNVINRNPNKRGQK